MSKVAISFGLNPFKLEASIPSIIYKGSLPPNNVPNPLIRIEGFAPGSSFVTIFIPAALP
jgi:hypothetical protein